MPRCGTGAWNEAPLPYVGCALRGVQQAVTAFHRFEASHTVSGAGDARVAVSGELDHSTAPQVREAVAACMAKRPKRLCLDLAGVSFCDCAGLNVLLEVRISVLQAGTDLVVEGIGTQLARLLSLIGAGHILTEGTTRADTILARSTSPTTTARTLLS